MGYFVYFSVRCSNYLTLFRVLMNHRVPFEWHSRTHCAGACYADFCLDTERDPTYSEIEAEAETIDRERGKIFTMTIMSEYEE